MGIAIVTGASRGIGASVAAKLAAQGHAVCVNYRRQADQANQLVERITDNGGQAIAVQADVADEQQVVHLFDTVDKQLGRVDMLVNNAGIIELQSRLQDMTLERFQNVMNTNVTGIVNMSSMAARLGSANEYVDYAASKGAVDTMTIGLATELADQGIRVNAVRPGIIYTDIHASGGEPNRIERVKHAVPKPLSGCCRIRLPIARVRL